jgi:Asp-tRNA(Asn)/Glu-tRNA(Gln) amidotransferase A subunit family amidase
MTDVGASSLSRRQALGWLAGLGITSATFARALAVETERAPIDKDSIARAEWISGVTLDDDQRERLVRSVERIQGQLQSIRDVELDADVPPALGFSTHADAYSPSETRSQPAVVKATAASVDAQSYPSDPIDIAFAPIAVLAGMLRSGTITSVQLTELFLDRLRTHGPTLNCVVTLTPDLAMEQAKRADQDLAAGIDHGPLHGIPWGAKDLIAVAGYKTTWGAEVYRQQVREQTATVAERLAAAGAVLVAKLSLGAIAMGDDWFGGRTLNPWNLQQGSSGSSAGSAAATAAGLVPFALGSETLGSIVSPSRRCGTTGLRPTFGRVSRAGCMPLAWSFDKIGPLCRSVEDCALVFAAIQGPDQRDPTVVSRSFQWPPTDDLAGLRVGYVGDEAERREITTLRSFGLEMVPIELPSGLPESALTMMLDVESASMFYDLWKDGTEEGLFRWPRTWQTAAFIPAIDYVRAARVRTLLMRQMEQVMQQVDLYVGGNDLVLTNLTGHPTVVMPYRSESTDQPPGQPGSLTFTGRLHGETRLLAVAQAFQNAMADHLIRPSQFAAQ